MMKIFATPDSMVKPTIITDVPCQVENKSAEKKQTMVKYIVGGVVVVVCITIAVVAGFLFSFKMHADSTNNIIKKTFNVEGQKETIEEDKNENTKLLKMEAEGTTKYMLYDFNRFTGGEACVACEDLHVQQHLCQDELVMKIKLSGALKVLPTNFDIDAEESFKGKILHVYKDLNNVGYKKGQKIELFTKVSYDHRCFGIIPSAEGTYVFSGFPTGDKDMGISMCSYKKLWSTMSKAEKIGLRKGYYLNNCGCEFINCSLMTDDESKVLCLPGNRCPYTAGDCFRSHGYCVTGEGNKCYWKITRQLKMCTKTKKFAHPSL